MAEERVLVFPILEVGRLYRRRDLHEIYGGQQQGGISTPSGRPYVLLFTGTGENYGYHDGWDKNGVFLYSGEGQIGDMQFRGGNKAIRSHSQDGKDLLLFEQLGKGQVRYLGCFACSTWEYREAKDKSGQPRRAIIFHLVPTEPEPPSPPKTVVMRTSTPISELRERALRAAAEAAQGGQRDAKRIYYERSAAVRGYVLGRANGVCESCGRPAPFFRPDDIPYLEPHHTRRLSDGGPDHPRWVGGICPNCHREIHHGVNGPEMNRRLQERLGELEEAIDEGNKSMT
jgi:5-methylcytosine-specific restriction enzyme A